MDTVHIWPWLLAGITAILGFFGKSVMTWIKDGFNAPSVIQKFEMLIVDFKADFKDLKAEFALCNKSHIDKMEKIEQKIESHDALIEKINSCIDTGKTLFLLIIDNEDDSARLLKEQIVQLGHKALTTNNYNDAIALLSGSEFDGILCDYELGNNHNGLQVFLHANALPKYLKDNGKCKFILYSGSICNIDNVPTGLQTLKKPFYISDLNYALKMAF